MSFNRSNQIFILKLFLSPGPTCFDLWISDYGSTCIYRLLLCWFFMFYFDSSICYWCILRRCFIQSFLFIYSTFTVERVFLSNDSELATHKIFWNQTPYPNYKRVFISLHYQWTAWYSLFQLDDIFIAIKLVIKIRVIFTFCASTVFPFSLVTSRFQQ